MQSSYEQLMNLIGERDDGQLFQQLLEALGASSEPTFQIQGSRFYDFDQFGLGFISENRIIRSVFFHIYTAGVQSGETMPYAGNFPGGITGGDDRTDVQRKLGIKPYHSAVVRGACSEQSGKQDYWDHYIVSNVEHTFIFDSENERLRSFSLHPARSNLVDVHEIVPSIKITIDRFTDSSARVLLFAQDEARRLNHSLVGTGPIALGLIADEDGLASQVMQSFGLNLTIMRAEVEKIIGKGTEPASVKLPFTPRVKNLFNSAWETTKELGDTRVDTEHLLLGMLDVGAGVAVQALRNLEVDLDEMRTVILARRDHSHSN